jgi:hypothetical protein
MKFDIQGGIGGWIEEDGDWDTETEYMLTRTRMVYRPGDSSDITEPMKQSRIFSSRSLFSLHCLVLCQERKVPIYLLPPQEYIYRYSTSP